MDSSLFTIWTICRNTISAWIRHPSYILAALIPCLAFLLVEFLASTVVSHSPIALVTLDHRPLGQKMQYIFHQADVFRITDATPQQAQELYNNIQVAAIITIPADFTQRVEAHEPSPVDVTINNLNLDFTNDIRRSVPDAITQFYQTQGSKSVIKVGMDVHNLRIHDIELFQYSVLLTIILLLTINGLV